MSERRGFSITVHFIVRAIVGMAVIYGLNLYLESQQIPVAVAFDIRNPWNSWGCAPLCDFVLSNFVRLSQS